MNSGFIGFYQEKDPYWCFSNWYPCKFIYAGREYSSLEQYMMYRKALIMLDYDAANKILATDSPAVVKKLGRSIEPVELNNYAGYKKIITLDIWNENKYFVVKEGIRAKLLQNKEILDELLNTGNKFIAECSPKDLVWGCGYSIDDMELPNVIMEGHIKGANLLGNIYMELREEFRNLNASGLKYVDYSNDSTVLNSRYIYEFYLNPLYHNAVSPFCDPMGLNNKSRFLKCTGQEIYSLSRIPGFNEMNQAICNIYYKQKNE